MNSEIICKKGKETSKNKRKREKRMKISAVPEPPKARDINPTTAVEISKQMEGSCQMEEKSSEVNLDLDNSSGAFLSREIAISSKKNPKKRCFCCRVNILTKAQRKEGKILVKNMKTRQQWFWFFRRLLLITRVLNALKCSIAHLHPEHIDKKDLDDRETKDKFKCVNYIIYIYYIIYYIYIYI